MAKRKAKRQKGFAVIVIMALIILSLTLIIPAIGTQIDSPAYWVDTVNFAEDFKTHFTSYWMFYTFGLALLLTVKKK